MRRALVLGLLAVANAAHADQRDDLQSSGEALGREGRWGEAIRAFKTAEQIEHRATHACLIALAYTRREAWPQAEVFLSRCLAPHPGETLPDWVPEARALIEQRLESEPLAEVTIAIAPARAVAAVTVSSFEPDEVFEPRTIHLPRGRHVIFARAPGFPDRQAVVEVDDLQPRRVVIDFEARTEPPVERGPRELRIAGIAALGLGIAGGVLGGTFNYMASNRAAAISRHPAEAWTLADEASYKQGQRFDHYAIASYVAGGVLVIAGAVMYYVGARTHVVPLAGGVAVGGTF